MKNWLWNHKYGLILAGGILLSLAGCFAGAAGAEGVAFSMFMVGFILIAIGLGNISTGDN